MPRSRSKVPARSTRSRPRDGDPTEARPTAASKSAKPRAASKVFGKRSKNTKPTGPTGPAAEYEIEALSGIEHVAVEELQSVPGVRDLRAGRFWFPGDPKRLTRLRASVAVYRVKTFDVPRPKALLGHQLLGELTRYLNSVIAYGQHQSFRLSAAGRESATLQRLAQELETLLGIPHHPEEGELLIRLRPAENTNLKVLEGEGGFYYEEGEWQETEAERVPEEGWDVLARLTPRPLSARSWRACNMAGGLNATVAYAMLKLAGVREADRIFNPMCGSATLLIERDLLGPSTALVGVDISAEAVACAEQNIAAAGRSIEVARVDALNTQLAPRSFDLIMADLPWGDAISVAGGNEALYTAFLKEMHRLISRQGRLLLLTHELRLFERLISSDERWHARELFQVYSGGHHPKAYLLSRA